MNGDTWRSPRPLPRLARRLPWHLRAVLGVAVALLGLWLTTRPVSSLTLLALYLGVTCVVLGAGELVSARRGSGQRATGVAWVAVGLVLVVLRGATSGVLPLMVAALMVVSGVLRGLRGRGLRTDLRWSALLLGAAEVALGFTALLWTDLTLVVVAVLFGIRAFVVGVQQVWDAVVGRRPHGDEPPPSSDELAAPQRFPRWGRPVASGLALVLALGVLGVSTGARERAPRVDAFYTTPDGVPGAPGRLLRAEPFAREVPDGAKGWRILYTTTDQDGSDAVASGLVVVPTAAAPSGGRRVVAWAHGTTGQARRCAPSLLDEPFTAGAFPAVAEEVVEAGWAVVATDYVGLGAEGEHAYLVGRVAGRAVLDAVRAARELAAATLGEQTVVWGHSQGGAAALWTAQVQPAYAPDVPLRGTVAMAPASDPLALAEGLADVTGGSVFASFVVTGYASAYDDVQLRDAVRPAAVPLVRRMASRCLAEPGVLASLLTALSLQDEDVLRGDVVGGRWGRRLEENVPLSPGGSPLVIAQGADDTLVTPLVQGEYVQRLRRTGIEVDYRVVPGSDHLSLVQAGSPWLDELLAWTAARFRGTGASAP